MSNGGKHTRLPDDDLGEDVNISHEVPPPKDPYEFQADVARCKAARDGPDGRRKADATVRRPVKTEEHLAKKPKLNAEAADGEVHSEVTADEAEDAHEGDHGDVTADEDEDADANEDEDKYAVEDAVTVVGVTVAVSEPLTAYPNFKASYIKRCDDLLFEVDVMAKVFDVQHALYVAVSSFREPVLSLRRQAAEGDGNYDVQYLQELERTHGSNMRSAMEQCQVDVRCLLDAERERRAINGNVLKEATEARRETAEVKKKAMEAGVKSSALHKQVQELETALHKANYELHQAADGHDDINSVFPTGIEIQQKVEEFGTTELNEIMLDILCPKLAVQDAARVMQFVMQNCDTMCMKSIEACEGSILLALGGGRAPVAKSKLLVGLLKRATQANWTTIRDSERSAASSAAGLVKGIIAGYPCFGDEADDVASLTALLTRVVDKLMEIIYCALLSDQGFNLNPECIGSRGRFDKDKHVGVDETLKEGSAIIVMFPALMCKNRVTVKALVLAKGYKI
eukprot:CAMPEP_0198681256 /NCGR_PEP_ID=MMETSP1468-20131203/6459_1 /TAXON_ID=1461545 /ORGANISM="Mantoniella sp, Strain CCMP1436" /LENGTH=512 /DNA_ID=CAMNT_0044422727 /DNA_START=244 /DNA_END=1782 /DNA_ORIENTATION=-